MFDEVEVKITLILVIDGSFVITYKQLIVTYYYKFCYFVCVSNP